MHRGKFFVSEIIHDNKSLCPSMSSVTMIYRKNEIAVRNPKENMYPVMRAMTL